MAAPALNLEEYKKNYGCGIPEWSPLYHEPMEGAPTTSVNLVGGRLLPPDMRAIDKDAITFGLDVLRGKGTSEGREKVSSSRHPMCLILAFLLSCFLAFFL